MTQQEYDAFRDTVAADIRKHYPVTPEVAIKMANAATDVLKRTEDAQVMALGAQIARRDAELLRLLAE